MRNNCEVSGCEAAVFAYGLCAKHDRRVRRHGSVDAGRPDGWGAAATHPLYHSWSWIRKFPCCDRWNSFWNFVDDVGERPDNSRLCRIDDKSPYSKENCEWRAKISRKPIKDRESKNEYMREYNLKKPHVLKDKYLKKLYGLSLIEYNKLLETQDHKCAICNQPEGAIDPYSKKPRKLAVDHCHKTGKVRGLLCTNCNTGTGRFNDDISLLKAAVKYLKSYLQ